MPNPKRRKRKSKRKQTRQRWAQGKQVSGQSPQSTGGQSTPRPSAGRRAVQRVLASYGTEQLRDLLARESEPVLRGLAQQNGITYGRLKAAIEGRLGLRK